jgi:hypothetical protein
LGGRGSSPQHGGTVIALHRDRVLYYAIPKVACSSIMAACVDALEIPLPPDVWTPEAFQTRKWDDLFDRQSIVIDGRSTGRYRDYWSFAFVRNPWDRLVSCYAEKIRDGDAENFVNGVSKILLPFGTFKAGMSFENFARAVVEIPDREAEPHFMSQHRFVVGKSGQLIVDFVGRFERLAADFAVVRRRISRPIELPHLLSSARGSYPSYYDATLAEIVGERYSDDAALFGYAF